MSGLRNLGAGAGMLPFSSLPAVAQDAPRYIHHGGHIWGDGMWAGAIFGPLLMFFYLALLVAVVFIVVRWLAGSPPGRAWPGPQSESNALNILKERFARGEIDKDEFNERRRVLEP